MTKLNKKPSKFLVLLEGRAFFELGTFYATQRILKKVTPMGDGHPVLVMPGFMASDKSTKPLRSFLKKKGYAAYGWDLGRNLGRLSYNEILQQRIRDLVEKHGQKVSLVGWSLGGIYARLLANVMPDHIRQVITMGSPFRVLNRRSNAHWLYERINNEKAGNVAAEIAHLVEKLPPVPFTAIYTKTDGVVAWDNSIEEQESSIAQNIRVEGSHCGLGHNAMVLYCIADRLAQPEHHWQKFSFTGQGCKKFFYPGYWQEEWGLAF